MPKVSDSFFALLFFSLFYVLVILAVSWNFELLYLEICFAAMFN